MRRAPVFVPCLLRFGPDSARQDAWGRLLELSAGGALLSTATRLSRGELVFLDLELAGERLAEVRAKIAYVSTDDDGRPLADLRFLDEVQRRALARALLAVLSRA